MPRWLAHEAPSPRHRDGAVLAHLPNGEFCEARRKSGSAKGVAGSKTSPKAKTNNPAKLVWLAGWWVGWLFGWLVGWLVGRSVGGFGRSVGGWVGGVGGTISIPCQSCQCQVSTGLPRFGTELRPHAAANTVRPDLLSGAPCDFSITWPMRRQLSIVRHP